LAIEPVNPKTVKRSTVVLIALFGAFVFLLLHILRIQTVDFKKYQDKVINQTTTESSIKASRGTIYDCNGAIMATNVTSYRVFISPRGIAQAENRTSIDSFFFKDRYGISEEEKASGLTHTEFVAEGLSKILEVDYAHVLEQTTYTSYLDRTVARQVDAATAEKVRLFISENKLEDEVYLEAIETRYYPYSTLASSVIGFTTSDGVGIYGLELQYNKDLSGTDGKYVTARDSSGKEMPYEYELYIPSKDGYNITTTIDVAMQAVLEKHLNETLKESGAVNRACAIIIDVETFAIKAMATAPSFDLNDPWTLNEYFNLELGLPGYDEESDEYKEHKKQLLQKMWSNKAIGESYIPGSTFKILTTAMGISEGVVNTNTGFICNGYEHFAGAGKVHCYKTTGHGPITLGGGLQQSCNVVFMNTGLRLGKSAFVKYFGSLGYTEKTGIDLPGESGSIFNLQSELDLAIYAFGQNFNVTPLQQICAVAAVANGGTLMTPYLVSQVKDDDGNVIYSHTPEVKRQVISESVCREVARILEEGVAGDGGAKNAYVAGYRVAAKTGTSEKKDASNIPIDVERYVVSTVGFAPADDPKYAVLLIVDEPTNAPLYGSTIAAPYVGKVFEEILPMANIEPEYSEDEAKSLSITVPDYSSAKWWAPQTVKNYAEKLGFEVEIVGNGPVVTSQIPAAGTKVLASGAKLILYTGNETPADTIIVPNVKGKTAAAANQILINAGLNIKIEGSKYYYEGGAATVQSQSHPAGTAVPKGTVITVNFGYYEEGKLE
jgi:stage V sporulation protein D (sporulation-specific penicillin-binding protein)